ncbi:serine hydrolase [Pseudonocardia sp. GCM10023141]|uniref:serine hydrolase n=1 Tax=Pseudonocardia sp. GCM10023141 TaxID=3252653 RepID=UPI003612CC19
MITAAVLTAVLLGLTGTAHAIVNRRAAAAGPIVATAAPVAAATSAPTTAKSAPAAKAAATAAPRSGSAAVVAAEQSVNALDESSTTTQIGAAVLDRSTGQLEMGDDGGTPFYSASVVKLYTVVAILHRVETGDVTLTDDVTDEIQRALSRSDDEAMDALWSGFGGSDTVTQAIALANLTDSSPPDDPSQWGEARISARDVVRLYNYMLTSMSSDSRTMIMNGLLDAQDTGADGFDQAFGLLNPPRPTGVAAKQGWMWYGSDLYLHSTGALGPNQRFVVAILTKGPANQATQSALVTKAAQGVEAALAKA